MPELVLLRHAEATEGAAVRDFDRPLTPAGRKRASQVGLQLAAAGVHPELVWASPARRTRETAELACKEMGVGGSRIHFAPAIYGAAAADLLAFLGEARNASMALLVGHNPGISELAAALYGQASLRLGPGDAVHLAFDGAWPHLGEAKKRPLHRFAR